MQQGQKQTSRKSSLAPNIIDLRSLSFEGFFLNASVAKIRNLFGPSNSPERLKTDNGKVNYFCSR